MPDGTYPYFDPAVVYPAFKSDRACDKCKTGDAEGDTPAGAAYDYSKDHIMRKCATCGYLWWERPKGD